MAVRQTARFSINPMRSHELAIMRIESYLCNNCEQGITYKIADLKELKSTLMQILQEDGVLQMQTILTLCYQGLVLLYAMLTVL
jgi:hypothetical protein